MWHSLSRCPVNDNKFIELECSSSFPVSRMILTLVLILDLWLLLITLNFLISRINEIFLPVTYFFGWTRGCYLIYIKANYKHMCDIHFQGISDNICEFGRLFAPSLFCPFTTHQPWVVPIQMTGHCILVLLSPLTVQSPLSFALLLSSAMSLKISIQNQFKTMPHYNVPHYS